MKSWQKVGVLFLGVMATSISMASVQVEKSDRGSVKVKVNEENQKYDDRGRKVSKVEVTSTRSKHDPSEVIEVEVNEQGQGRRMAKKDIVRLNTSGNDEVQIAVDSSENSHEATSNVDVNAYGPENVEVEMESSNSDRRQVNVVEVNAAPKYKRSTRRVVQERNDDEFYYKGSVPKDDEEIYYVVEEDDDDDYYRYQIADYITPVLAVRLGVDVAEVGSDQYITVREGLSGSDYLLDDDASTEMVWGAFGGIELPVSESGIYSWQTGVAYYQTQPFHVSGKQYPVGDQSMADYEFSYEVQNLRIMWENKLLMSFNNRFSGYLLAGIGWARNEATEYEENILASSAQPNPLFEDNTTSSFSYSFGLGLEMALMEQMRLGLGYQFSELGKVELGDRDWSGVTSDTLNSSHTYTHEVILGLSYLFN